MTRPTTTGKAQDLITFTRSTTGTALAKISYGEELVTNGTFDNGTTGWSKSNAASSIAAVNNQLVVTLGSTYNNTYTSIATEAGKAYTASVNLISSTSAAIYIGAGLTGNSYSLGLSSDIDDGTKGTITFTASGSVTFIQLHVNGSSGQQATFDNVSVKEVLYDQPDGTLQLFNHPINKPRLEYDASGNCLGLLVEEARTNFFINSIPTSGWTTSNTTLSFNVAESPDGQATAGLFAETATGNAHMAYQAGGFNFVSGTAYTSSLYVKANTATSCQLTTTSSGFGSTAYANFDLSNGTLGTTGASATSSIQEIGNGWYRISMTATAVTSASGSGGFIALNNNNPSAPRLPLYVGDTNQSIYVWGNQVETGSFPTSYIPTSGSTVTRSKDVASLALSKFGYNQDQFSVVVKSDFFGDDGTSYLCYIGEESTNRIILYYSNQNINFQVKSGGVNQATETLSGHRDKAAYRYKLNDMNLAADGDITTEDTPPNLLISGTQNNIYIGGSFSGGNTLNGHIKSIQYYPLGLPNAQLQALTV